MRLSTERRAEAETGAHRQRSEELELARRRSKWARGSSEKEWVRGIEEGKGESLELRGFVLGGNGARAEEFRLGLGSNGTERGRWSSCCA